MEIAKLDNFQNVWYNRYMAYEIIRELSPEIELLAGTPYPNETPRHIIACNDYLRLGPTRTLLSLDKQYREHPELRVYSRKKMTQFSSDFKWADRAVLYDRVLEEKKTALATDIKLEGYALAQVRIDKLSSIAELLYPLIMNYKEKSTRTAPDRRVIEQYRYVLADIAAEVGGRKGLVDVTSGGKPLIDPVGWREKEQERLAKAEALEYTVVDAS